MFEGFLEAIVRHADHGDTGYRKEREKKGEDSATTVVTAVCYDIDGQS